MFLRLFSPAPVILRTGMMVAIAVGGAGVSLAQGPAPQCPVPPAQNQALAPDLLKTVVVTDPAAMANFSLARTLNAIIESTPGHAGPATEAERVAFLQSLLSTFKENEIRQLC